MLLGPRVLIWSLRCIKANLSKPRLLLISSDKVHHWSYDRVVIFRLLRRGFPKAIIAGKSHFCSYAAGNHVSKKIMAGSICKEYYEIDYADFEVKGWQKDRNGRKDRDYTQRAYDVYKMPRHDGSSTLIRRCLDAMCTLGFVRNLVRTSEV